MTKLTAIGNSQGIRIPKPLIKQAKLENVELELIIMDKGLLIQPIIKIPRESWVQNIQEVLLKSEEQDNALLSELLNDNDLEDWEW